MHHIPYRLHLLRLPPLVTYAFLYQAINILLCLNLPLSQENLTSGESILHIIFCVKWALAFQNVGKYSPDYNIYFLVEEVRSQPSSHSSLDFPETQEPQQISI